MRMIASPKIEKPALAYQKIVVFKQVPGSALFHARGTGVHWNVDANVVAVPYAVTQPSKAQQV
jgi:hypothetical protein